MDWLKIPWIGARLRSRRARPMLQIPALVICCILIVHGLFGPELAPKNLATLVVWVHYRGLLVLGLLFAGNLFCAACPFVLVRDFARRFIEPKRIWPRRLRNKWIAAAAFASILFAYEWLDLWGEARWTAWLIVGYFAAALVVDLSYQRASFCKWVCPIGQFNFVASTLSPFEVGVRSSDACFACSGKECIRGRVEADGAGAQRGCELELFLPRKVGNLDCTFCLDCVHACPHDNIGIVARRPADELADERRRSGVGRVEERADFAALFCVFTFGALLNAFGMIGPVYAVEQQLANVLGTSREAPVLAIIFIIILVIVPAILLGAAGAVSRTFLDGRPSVTTAAVRFAPTLAPVGFGVWLAHYSFHFLTGFLTVVPVTQSALIQCGITVFGAPCWSLGGLPVGAVHVFEWGFLSLGVLGSCIVTFQVAARAARTRAISAFIPWAALHIFLGAAAFWILRQPMEMRGTFLK